MSEPPSLPSEMIEAAMARLNPTIRLLAGKRMNSLAALMIAKGAASTDVQAAALLAAEAGRWPTMRASRIGSEDNQRHSLSHAYKIYAALDLPPLELVGLEALGLLGLKWRIEAAFEYGWKAGPLLTRQVLAEPQKARICRLTGALVTWQHMREAYTDRVACVTRLVASGQTSWRQKKVTPEQRYLLARIEELVRADDDNFRMPDVHNRGEAFDIIDSMGGNPLFHEESETMIVAKIVELIKGLDDFEK